MAEDIRKVVTDLLLWKAEVRSVIGEIIVWAATSGMGTDRAGQLLDKLYEQKERQS